MNQSYAGRFADFVEAVAARARALSVDRLARFITLTSLGLGAVLLLFLALVLACIGLFRLLAVGVGVTGAYAIFGGAFLAGGWSIWRRRAPAPEEPNA